ncbi:MAG: NAD-dependent epimerase/dehydratase family protein [Actinobacteria bacterium]|nr:NAD-dependent epimerase/dehydratase family protein [Actinomycetota bacterium]
MRILVLGGTIFVGRHIVEAALARGDEVTLFNRGLHGAQLFREVEQLRGDRDGDLSALAGRSWDAVVDTSGYFPRAVRASARELADRVDHYTFISSGSVYADFSRPGIDESAPTLELAPDAPEELSSPEAYGGFKALSERAVEEALPSRALKVRAGVIVGPHDPTNRFTYWVTRIAEGGEVLAPEPRGQPVQVVDARDLADWVLRMADERRGGVFNAAGQGTTLEAFLTGIQDATGSDADLTWVDERFLADAGVEPFQELPFWLAPNVDPAWAYFLALDASQAVRAGLTFRPLAETVGDTLAWALESGPAGPKDVGVAMAPAGMSPERERGLLDVWRRRAA